MKYILFTLLFVTLAGGLWLLADILNANTRAKEINAVGKWYRDKSSIWDNGTVKRLCRFFMRFITLDDSTKDRLSRDLRRAGYDLTPEEYTARKVVIITGGAVGIGLCCILRLWIGIGAVALLCFYGLLKEKEMLTKKLKARDEAIRREMPSFVRTICRSLKTNRDILSAVQSYRNVAGAVLGEELDKLLSHARSGSIAQALQQFQMSIGSEAAFRLCTALLEIDRGVDQSATLDLLADDMARESRLIIQKELSLRPAKMRATYLPAVAVCIVMILYVLAQFVMTQLNTLF
ncbi:MAG: hypothetical protein II881_08785 [Oscillospiraceae bacterium]|nr:hypothetical protein [Oscillospiraceae bacterium]